MTHLIIKKKNEVFVTIDSEQYVYHELSDHFTFEVPGASLCHNIVISIGMER